MEVIERRLDDPWRNDPHRCCPAGEIAHPEASQTKVLQGVSALLGEIGHSIDGFQLVPGHPGLRGFHTAIIPVRTAVIGVAMLIPPKIW
jgi:hypothetical protein